MKTKHFFQNLKTATLMVALSLSMSSCQELVESIFGSSIDNPVPSEPTSQTPTESESGIRLDYGIFTPQINTLEERIAILEAQDMDVTQLKKNLEALKTEVAKNTNTGNVEAGKEIQNKIDLLDEAISKASSVMITGVILQETLDCVVGTINLPGFTPAFLAAYVGENKTGMPEFPISGKEYNVDPNGNYLLASELPQGLNGNWNEDAIIGNSGKNAYLTNGTGNAGTLYFTINPRKVDPSLLQVDLINSLGEETGITLSDIQKSDHLITYAIGKHNNYTRGGDENSFIVPTPVNVENEKTYLYEAKATVTLDAIEKMHFYYTKFGYDNLWDAGYELTGATQSADNSANNMFGGYQYLAEAVKSKTATKVLQKSLTILQDFYNGVYSQRAKLQKSAVRVSWDDGVNDVISGFDITPVAINPLNFKQLFLLDNINMPWGFKNYEKALGDIAKTIQSKASSTTSVTLKSVSIDGTQPKMTLTAGDADVVVDITEEVYNAINNGMELSTLENMVNSILHPYQTISASSNTMTRVNNFLDKIGASVMIGQGGNVAWNGVEPILLFENMEGISQLHSDMTINGSGPTTFIMTSLTEEYIVPAYRKYIAIVQNGSVLKYYSVDGKEKIAQLNLPIGDSEIVYQVSDFYGNVVTKRYPVTRKQ